MWIFVATSAEEFGILVDFLDRKACQDAPGSQLQEEEGDPGRWRKTFDWGKKKSRRCFTVPAVRNLFLIGSYSKFWTDPGTPNASSAASANAV